MRLIVDAQPIYGQRAGVGAYVYEVVKRLPGILAEDEIRLVLFRFLKKEPIPEGILGNNVTIAYHKFFPRKLLEGGMKAGIPLPFPWFSGDGDAFLFPNFVSYPTRGRPSALIVYDLSYHRYPKMAERKNKAFLSRFVPPSLKRATAVITISEFSRREISEIYGVPPEKIHIAYPGVDSGRFRPMENSEKIRDTLNKYSLPSDYLLFIGTLEPRKGITPLLEAYQTWNSPDKPPLVLVGKRGWGDLPLLEKALSGKIPGVFIPGYIVQDDLPVLLSQARAFVYPSDYEGFGMPVLEAMACGVPVVCGSCPSFPEIGGELLFSCQASDPNALRSAIEKAVFHPPSPDVLREGIRRAKSFTWENTAQMIAEVIRKMVDKKS